MYWFNRLDVHGAAVADQTPKIREPALANTEFGDVFGRPVLKTHAQRQSACGQHVLDLGERLLAQIRASSAAPLRCAGSGHRSDRCFRPSGSWPSVPSAPDHPPGAAESGHRAARRAVSRIWMVGRHGAFQGNEAGQLLTQDGGRALNRSLWDRWCHWSLDRSPAYPGQCAVRHARTGLRSLHGGPGCRRRRSAICQSGDPLRHQARAGVAGW
jgi:hypothetical protein